ncbi:MAG: hypothetical protein ACK5FV_14495 [Bacteroidota bacterium]|jgi:hypothetical protein|nr:hypothetical protein [Saprospiraceae bacterium]
MRNVRPGFYSYVLLALILFQGAGWMLSWQAMQFHARISADIAVSLPETPSLHLTLSTTMFQRVRIDRKEIRLDGNLYDIRSAIFTGDSVHLELYHDKREQALFALLKPHVSFLTDYSPTQTPPLAAWAAQWLATPFTVPESPVIGFFSKEVYISQFYWLGYLPDAPPADFFQPPRA